MEGYRIKGMTCSACSAHVERAVSKLDAVESVQVNLLTNSMNVKTRDGKPHAEEIKKAVADAGYEAFAEGGEAVNDKNTAAPDETGGLARRFIVSLCLLLPLMYISMQHMAGWPIPALLNAHHYPMVNALTQMTLTLIIMYINRAFFISGIKRLKALSPNMDSLIAVGSGAAFIYGLATVFRMAVFYGDGNADMAMQSAMELYFESAAMILTLITLGKTLEARAKKKTTSAIEKLLELAPDTVTLVTGDETRTVPAAEIKVGDVLLIRPGERIPFDGVLLDGHIALDQSHITGESVPVDKSAGDELISGSMNESFSFKMRATKVGEDTTLSKIVRLVQEAGASKAPIAKVADRVSGVFVPVVIGISLITFVIWMLVGRGFAFALSCAIAVLVISCPCALGLATPVAIMVGTGVGAKHGILFRNGEVLETLQHVTDMVFDKTGTLTQGRMRVSEAIPAPGVSEKELVGIAYALESGSEHPVAKAAVEYCASKGAEAQSADGFKAWPGLGVSADIDGVLCLAGSPKMMKEQGVDLSPLESELEAVMNRGRSALCFTRGGRLLGIMGVSDAVKRGAREAVESVRLLGITPHMITGDQKLSAMQIAGECGIDDVRYEVLPGQKAEAITEIRSGGGVVAMIGDGINDAPALAEADIGIAVGGGTDIAIETADVALTGNRLGDISTAVRLSRAVIRNIKENLFWAFFYNTVGIPIAAGALEPWLGITLSPMLGAAAMSLSSFCVVSNALRLRRFKANTPPAANTGEAVKATSIKEEVIKMEKTVYIEGMSCNHCKMSVEKALSALPDVMSADVDLSNKLAVVKLNADVSGQKLMDVVREAGFEPVRVE